MAEPCLKGVWGIWRESSRSRGRDHGGGWEGRAARKVKLLSSIGQSHFPHSIVN